MTAVPVATPTELTDAQVIGVLVTMWLDTLTELETERARNGEARRLAAQLGLTLEGQQVMGA